MNKMLKVDDEHEFNKKNAFIFLLAIAVMLIIYFLRSPPDLYRGTEPIPLTHDGKTVCALLMFAVILWIT